MLRRRLGEELGYFDPAYPFYIEDVDLSLRIIRAGHELRLVPGVTIVHLHAMSSSQRTRGERLLWATEGVCRLVATHYPPLLAKAVLGAMALTHLRDLMLYTLLTVFTLGLARGLRSRAAACPRALGTCLRALCCGARPRSGA
jgi:GT2 family glycosyltransferase